MRAAAACCYLNARTPKRCMYLTRGGQLSTNTKTKLHTLTSPKPKPQTPNPKLLLHCARIPNRLCPRQQRLLHAPTLRRLRQNAGERVARTQMVLCLMA